MAIQIQVMVDEPKDPDELKLNVVKPEIDKPDGDSKPNNSRLEVAIVDTSSQFVTDKTYKD
ncbi:hypothetical protein TSUD_230030 [Trifolium subterraneum]|uniref:Uncharacterized protein n=1 Tax=Trifolium subterraneum TaxID=3900 RepID=A0A2Z6LUT0_TRISU|nr:hypothetical protein TSUD_230030 [Trifolium subterraneum]